MENVIEIGMYKGLLLNMFGFQKETFCKIEFSGMDGEIIRPGTNCVRQYLCYHVIEHYHVIEYLGLNFWYG